MSATFIGIDSGTKSGAIGAFNEEGDAGAIFLPMIGSGYIDTMQLYSHLAKLEKSMGTIVAVTVEMPQARTYMDGKGIRRKQNTDTSFRAYGQVHSVLQIKGYRIIEVPAQTWKKKMNLWGKDKEESVRIATQLFPKVEFKLKKDHNRAEALLIAEYGRRFLK